MKKFIFLLIMSALCATAAFSQKKVGIENRDGKAVIVTRDTTETGETKETIEWKSNPTDVLTKQLKDVDRYAEWLQTRIEVQTAELKQKLQEKSDLETALQELQKGIIIETGRPEEIVPDPTPAKSKSADQPAPKKKRNKKRSKIDQ